MLRTAWFVTVLAICAVTCASGAEDIGWQEAVARLAQERTLAESCAGLLKKYGDSSAVDRGKFDYAEAKAEYDGIIVGLDVALASNDRPASLPELETRLKRGFDKRQAFCDSVQKWLPPRTRGRKGPIADIVGGVVGPVIDALKAIWLRTRDDNALMRKTIETQLEATTWPSFAAVSPSS
jgi:hypothetical protein